MPRAPGWGCCGSSNLSDIGSDCPRYEEGCFSKLQGNCLAIVPKRLTSSVLDCIIVYVEKQWMDIFHNTETLWLSSFTGRFRSVGSLLHECCSYDLCVEKNLLSSAKNGIFWEQKMGTPRSLQRDDKYAQECHDVFIQIKDKKEIPIRNT